MLNSKIQSATARNFRYGGLLLGLLLVTVIPAISADDRKTEIIDATAMGTSTQMGKTVCC